MDRVVELIMETGAEVIYAPHLDEYHPDHRAVNKIAGLAAWKAMYLRGRWIERLYEYEVWPPMRSFTDVVNITDYVELKRKALEVYAKGSMRHLNPDAPLALNMHRAFCFKNASASALWLGRASAGMTSRKYVLSYSGTGVVSLVKRIMPGATSLGTHTTKSCSPTAR